MDTSPVKKGMFASAVAYLTSGLVAATSLVDTTSWVDTIESLSPLIVAVKELLPDIQALAIAVMSLLAVILVTVGFIMLFVAILSPHTYAKIFEYIFGRMWPKHK